MQLKELYDTLFNKFGPQHWWPVQRTGNDTERFEVMAGAVLTQNTSWKNVERALHNLRKGGLLSPEAMLQTDEKTLAGAIRPAGYYNQKARKLKTLSRALARFGREPTREELLGIWGLGPETVDSILLYAYGKPYFVIDSYTRRLLNRLGLTESENIKYDDLQGVFRQQLPENIAMYKEFHALIVRLCKEYCKKKPLCRRCPLARSCGFSKPEP